MRPQLPLRCPRCCCDVASRPTRASYEVRASGEETPEAGNSYRLVAPRINDKLPSMSPAAIKPGNGPSSSPAQSTSSTDEPSARRRARVLAEHLRQCAEPVAAGDGQPRTQPRCHSRAQPAGGHGHGDGPVAVQRRKDERGMGTVVRTVDPHAVGLCVCMDGAVDIGLAGRREHQTKTCRVALAIGSSFHRVQETAPVLPSRVPATARRR